MPMARENNIGLKEDVSIFLQSQFFPAAFGGRSPASDGHSPVTTRGGAAAVAREP
jgi:hypothetical protein